jgi:hypothetical protein
VSPIIQRFVVIGITLTLSEVLHHLSGSIFLLLERCSVEDPLEPFADVRAYAIGQIRSHSTELLGGLSCPGNVHHVVAEIMRLSIIAYAAALATQPFSTNMD